MQAIAKGHSEFIPSKCCRCPPRPGMSESWKLCAQRRCGELMRQSASSSSSRHSGIRGSHSLGTGRITAPGSSWPQSIRIVDQKRRPSSNVDSRHLMRSCSKSPNTSQEGSKVRILLPQRRVSLWPESALVAREPRLSAFISRRRNSMLNAAQR